jgi:hypothetical protein
MNTGHPLSIRTVSPYGPIDDHVTVFRFPENKRTYPSSPSFFELPRQLVKGGGAFGDNHDARGIFVQSMDDSWPDSPPIPCKSGQ